MHPSVLLLLLVVVVVLLLLLALGTRAFSLVVL